MRGSVGRCLQTILAAALAGALLGADTGLDTDGDGLTDLEEQRPIQRVRFSDRIVIDPVDTVFSLTDSADFDGDGVLEVIASRQGGLTVFGAANRAGVFGEQQVLGPIRGDRGIGGDIDGDGDLDVVAHYSTSVHWYENLGGGESFGASRPVGSHEGYFLSSAVADLDGDGDMDVAAGHQPLGTVWWENLDGRGQFGEMNVLGGLGVWQELVDLDGDGDLDVLNTGGGLGWYENTDGGGTFGKRSPIGADGLFAAAADLNADGHVDAISSGGWWYPGPPLLGAFGQGRPLPEETLLPYFSDLDRDGDLDMITDAPPGYGPHDVGWYENLDGLGTFSAMNLVDALPGRAHVEVDDVDGDGDDDIVASVLGNVYGPLLWYRNDSVRSSDPLHPDSDRDGLGDGAELREYGTDPNRADSDRDGLSDPFEVAAGFDPLMAGEHLEDSDADGVPNPAEQAGGTDPNDPDSDGDGLSDGEERRRVRSLGFGSPRPVSTVADGSDPIAADLDGDGDQDVLMSSYPVRWHRNLGRGASFSTVVRDAAASFVPAEVELSDVDRDGDPDILFATYGFAGWAENVDGSGAFEEAQILDEFLVGPTPSDPIAAVDFDADGDEDVLLVSEGRIAWYENLDGRGSFGAGALLLASGAPGLCGVAAAYLGPSDLPHVIAADYDGIYVYAGLRGGLLGPPVQIATGLDAIRFRMEVVDVDGDSNPDVGGGWVVPLFHRGRGASRFGPRVFLGEARQPVAWADVDGDGDLDVLGRSYEAASPISWWENLDSEGAVVESTIFSWIYGVALGAGDLDGDGDPDLLAARDGMVEWYPNLGSDPLDPASPAPEPASRLLASTALLVLLALRAREKRRPPTATGQGS